MAARVRGTDQNNSRSSLGLAPRRQKPCLPSCVRRVDSLKAVLPALVPEMNYDNMLVANGQDAGLAWESLVRGGLDQSERESTRKALLDYCGKDTLALVRLLEKVWLLSA